MKKLILRKKLYDVGRKKDNRETCEKPPYATAPLSMNIPYDDLKPRMNVDYQKPPKQLVERRKCK